MTKKDKQALINVLKSKTDIEQLVDEAIVDKINESISTDFHPELIRNENTIEDIEELCVCQFNGEGDTIPPLRTIDHKDFIEETPDISIENQVNYGEPKKPQQVNKGSRLSHPENLNTAAILRKYGQHRGD
jgi:hypothetical protein